MIIVLMIITIIIGVFLYFTEWEEFAVTMVIPFIVEFIAFIVFVSLLVGTRIIDNKIKLYESQNKDIEEKIEVTVKNYMEYEGNTYKELKPDSYIQIINLYPELKADKLVEQQINLYIKNNKKIIELKEEKLNKTLYKWWIYFGK